MWCKGLECSTLLLYPQSWWCRHGEAHWAAEGKEAEPACHLWREALHHCKEGPPSAVGSQSLDKTTLDSKKSFNLTGYKHRLMIQRGLSVCIRGHEPGQLKSSEMMVSPAAGASRVRASGSSFNWSYRLVRGWASIA